MTLEREVEILNTELQRHDNQSKRWIKEREQVISVSICTVSLFYWYKSTNTDATELNC
jgi:hypothetical protein